MAVHRCDWKLTPLRADGEESYINDADRQTWPAELSGNVIPPGHLDSSPATGGGRQKATLIKWVRFPPGSSGLCWTALIFINPTGDRHPWRHGWKEEPTEASYFFTTIRSLCQDNSGGSVSQDVCFDESSSPFQAEERRREVLWIFSAGLQENFFSLYYFPACRIHIFGFQWNWNNLWHTHSHPFRIICNKISSGSIISPAKLVTCPPASVTVVFCVTVYQTCKNKWWPILILHLCFSL